MNRRDFLRRSALASGAVLLPTSFVLSARAEELPSRLRIGYQKTSALLLVKARKLIEKRLEPKGVAVEWVEFPFGPPLLEALQAGAIDYGYKIGRANV